MIWLRAKCIRTAARPSRRQSQTSFNVLNELAWLKNAPKLDPVYEQNMAEEGLALEMDEWPEY